MSAVEPVKLPSKARAGKDTAKAKELGDDIEGVSGAAAGLTRAQVVNPLTGVGRDVGVKYSFVNQAWDNFSTKAKLHAVSGGQFTISDSDVEGYKNVSRQNAQQKFDQWCLAQWDPQVPGQLALLEKVNPDLVRRMVEGIDSTHKMMADMQRVSLMAPRTEDEARLRFLMDQGMLDEYKSAIAGLGTLATGKIEVPDSRALFYRWLSSAGENRAINRASFFHGQVAPSGLANLGTAPVGRAIAPAPQGVDDPTA